MHQTEPFKLQSRVWPETGESLACWITRTAYHNRLSGPELLSFLCRGSPPRGDIDATSDRSLLTRLSNACQCPPDLAFSTCEMTIDRAFVARSPVNPKRVWLALSGPTDRQYARVSRYQVCPICLTADRVPHLRLNWHFAYTAVCDEHAVVLLDACPHCTSPIYLCLSDANVCVKSLYSCAKCGTDFRNVLMSPCSNSAIKFQALVRAAMRSGYFTLGSEGAFYSHLLRDLIAVLAPVFLSNGSQRATARAVRRLMC